MNKLFVYYPMAASVDVDGLKVLLRERNVPLLEDKNAGDGIYIDKDSRAVETVEETIRRKYENSFFRFEIIEVQKNDIGKFKQYKLNLNTVREGKDIEIPVKNHPCGNYMCPYGQTFDNLVYTSAKGLNADLHEVTIIPRNEEYLLISERVRVLFEDNRITGLAYSEVEVKHRDKIKQTVYIAEIQNHIIPVASSVKIGKLGLNCTLHNTVYDDALFGGVREIDFGDSDFNTISAVAIKKVVYNLTTPRFTVSSKALLILTQNDIKGLLTKNSFSKNTYTPFTFGVEFI